MPTNTKNPDVVYSWVDEAGKTHYSNVKNVDIPAAKPHFQLQTPQQESVQKIPKPEAKTIQPQKIMPAKTVGGTLTKGFGTIAVLLIIVLAFRAFLDNLIEKKRRERLKNMRSCQEPRTHQTIIQNNHYHTTIVTQPVEAKKDIPPLTQLIREKNAAEYNEKKIIEGEFSNIAPATALPKPTNWTLKLIQSLEWREFENLCAKTFEGKGLCAKLGKFQNKGDHGKDIHIYMKDQPSILFGIAQCKAWEKEINEKPMRDFLGTMTDAKISKGFFFASGEFSQEASAFGERNKIEMITGKKLLEKIYQLPEGTQTEILNEIVQKTDYTTPTCRACGIKMIMKKKKLSGEKYWGCVNHPKCKITMKLRRTDKG